MTEDARFEDAGGRALHLGALDAEDLKVISSLAQDSVLPVTEIRYQPRRRRLALLLNRVRWEDVTGPRAAARPPERVRSLLVFDNVLSVSSQGVDRTDTDLILSILAISFEEGPPPGGHVLLTLAGDGVLRAEVEALEVTLRDVTRPYLAPSGKLPKHPD
ncbi:DUF2948 family protein [Pseudoponticoccus marisrubri]|uniref:DUF2948 domain-containing protein n=1 Tax=Pseudoponticoccus marisrubri TaxID=1685382 RepID=A0A0W7WPB0_9RHOB|nr:DUF2948 family protein [Pseudoponticoccus marisrubri]KUF12415.1 hypothetical protein AVJ23_01415 [Pseudoponticoccus marisrubri]